MKALTTLIVLSITVTITVLAISQQSSAGERTNNAAPYTALNAHGIHGADADQEADINAAILAFDQAGLLLPDLQIYVHESNEGCNKNLGLFSQGGDKHRIDICMAHPSVIRHELAHAWEHHNMTDATRRAFLQRRGIEAWNDQESSAQVRGIEQAAYLIAWGLDSRPIQSLLRSRHAEDLDLYELLTGSQSPRIAVWDADSRLASPTNRSEPSPVPTVPSGVRR
jgi:hypothetical protein